MSTILKHFLGVSSYKDYEPDKDCSISQLYYRFICFWENFKINKEMLKPEEEKNKLLSDFQNLDLRSCSDENVILILMFYSIQMEIQFFSHERSDKSVQKILSFINSKTHHSITLSIESFTVKSILKKGKIKEVRDMLEKIPFESNYLTKRDVDNCLRILKIISDAGLISHFIDFSNKLIQYNNGEFSPRIYTFSLYDAISRGDIFAMNKYLELINSSKSRNQLFSPPIIMELLKGHWDPNFYLNNNIKISEMEKMFLLIHENKFLEALELIKKYLSQIVTNYLYLYQEHLLFCELCNKNIASSEILLKWLEDYEPFSFLINFYRMYLSLLKEDFKNAQIYYFESIKKSLEQNTQGLLEFYLKLSPIITKDILLKLHNSVIITNEVNIQNENKDEFKNSFTQKIIGNSYSILKVKENINTFANTTMPVLILGETGVGKDLVANALHLSSNRSKHPFLSINCGALNESLLQSELFGHEKGTFTGATKTHKGIFESAGEGTVFLDEIGETSTNLQVSLLRVLENREIKPLGKNKAIPINCQIVLATNADLEQKVKNGEFREDLYYRINQLVIHVPPLRERKEDILVLATYFFNLNTHSNLKLELTNDLIQALENYPWLGNIRQLKSQINIMRMFGSEKRFYELKDFEESMNQRQSQLNIPIKNKPELKQISTLQDIGENDLSEIKRVQENRKSKLRKDKNDRIERIKKLFQALEKIYRIDLIETFKISPPTATSDLKYLEKTNFIKKVKPNPAPRSHYYILNKGE